MDRRTALKSLAITVWGMMVLPGCNPDEIQETELLYKSLPLDETQRNNLRLMVDTFLPETDSKGGVELSVHEFVNKLLANCYEEEIQKSFLDGLNILENKSQELAQVSFGKNSSSQREAILMQMDDEEKIEEKAFFDLSKELVILGYTSSEYFLTNFTNYEMIPGGYDGCVPVPDEPFKI